MTLFRIIGHPNKARVINIMAIILSIYHKIGKMLHAD